MQAVRAQRVEKRPAGSSVLTLRRCDGHRGHCWRWRMRLDRRAVAGTVHRGRRGGLAWCHCCVSTCLCLRLLAGCFSLHGWRAEAKAEDWRYGCARAKGTRGGARAATSTR